MILPRRSSDGSDQSNYPARAFRLEATDCLLRWGRQSLTSEWREPAELDRDLALKRERIVIECAQRDALGIQDGVCSHPRIDEQVSRETPDVSRAHREHDARPFGVARDAVVLDRLLPDFEPGAEPPPVETRAERVVDHGSEDRHRRRAEPVRSEREGGRRREVRSDEADADVIDADPDLWRVP